MISTSSMIPNGDPPYPTGTVGGHVMMKGGYSGHHHHHHSISVPPGGSLSMDPNQRQRFDSQKFLVPSLPGKLEPINGPPGPMKRRDSRGNCAQMLSGLGQVSNVSGESITSPSGYPQASDIHHQSLLRHHHMATNPVNYAQSRSSLPVPCSSPVPASSASPKALSPPRNSIAGHTSTYSHLPSGDLGGSLFSQSGYPNLAIPPNHPAAFFAAAAAAASASAYPFPPFMGSPSPYGPTAAYFNNFHANLMSSASKGQSGQSVVNTPYLPPHLRNPYHSQGTSTTTLHTKVESASERYSGHGHSHLPSGELPNRFRASEYPPFHPNGLSKGAFAMNTVDPVMAQALQKKFDKPPNFSPTSLKLQQRWEEHRDLLTPSQGHYPKLSPNNGQYHTKEVHHIQPMSHNGPSVRKQEPPLSADFLPQSPHRSKTMADFFKFPPEQVSRGAYSSNDHNYEPQPVKDVDSQMIPNDSTRLSSGLLPPPPNSPRKRKYGLPQKDLDGNSNDSMKCISGLNTFQVPSSPSYLTGTSKVPKSPTVTFKTNKSQPPPSPKKILQENNHRLMNLPPLGIEEMPEITSFRQGSLIQLANGDIKSVENLCGEDFTHSAEQMTDSIKIIYCTVLGIDTMVQHGPTTPPTCKIMLGMEPNNRHILLNSALEQPYFTVGRGWTSISPELTKRLLQLNCLPLRVGDVCMTLTRKRNRFATKSKNVTFGKNQKPGAIKPDGTAKLIPPVITVEDPKPTIHPTNEVLKNQIPESSENNRTSLKIDNQRLLQSYLPAKSEVQGIVRNSKLSLPEISKSTLEAIHIGKKRRWSISNSGDDLSKLKIDDRKIMSAPSALN